MQYARFACAVPNPDNEKEVIIIGGTINHCNMNCVVNNQTTVSVYNEEKWQRDLAPLQQGRDHHACSSFTHAGEKVIFLCVLKNRITSCLKLKFLQNCYPVPACGRRKRQRWVKTPHHRGLQFQGQCLVRGWETSS